MSAGRRRQYHNGPELRRIYRYLPCFGISKKKRGSKVLYEEATTPEEMYSKYTSSTIPYDLICSSDYMIERSDRRRRGGGDWITASMQYVE